MKTSLVAIGFVLALAADARTPVVSVVDVTTWESNNPAVPVRLSEASDDVVKVAVSTADDTAHAGDDPANPNDYIARSFVLTIPPGDVRAEISLTVRNDRRAEDTERFFVRLSDPTNAALGDAEAVVTIMDGRKPPTRPAQPPQPGCHVGQHRHDALACHDRSIPHDDADSSPYCEATGLLAGAVPTATSTTLFFAPDADNGFCNGCLRQTATSTPLVVGTATSTPAVYEVTDARWHYSDWSDYAGDAMRWRLTSERCDSFELVEHPLIPKGSIEQCGSVTWVGDDHLSWRPCLPSALQREAGREEGDTHPGCSDAYGIYGGGQRGMRVDCDTLDCDRIDALSWRTLHRSGATSTTRVLRAGIYDKGINRRSMTAQPVWVGSCP